MDAPELEKLILLLISGMTAAAVKEVAVTKLGIAPDRTGPLLAEAQTRIVLAARYNREEEIGRAIRRYHDCYSKAAAIQDVKTALAANDRLCRLMALYRQPTDEPTDETPAAENPDLAAIAAHLLPLGLAPADYPLPEHARIAADRLRACDPTCNQPPTNAENSEHRAAAARKRRPAKKSAASRRSKTPAASAPR